jgi:hypothetical protein
LAAGIPVIGASYGALGEAHPRERLVAGRSTHRSRRDPRRHRTARSVTRRVVRVTREAMQVPLESVADTAHRYAALYGSALAFAR